MKTLRNICSIVLHVLAGLVVAMAETIAFFQMPVKGKLMVLGGFAITAVVLFAAAMLLGKFRSRLRPVGICLLSASAYMAFSVLAFVCMLMTPELMQMIATQTPGFRMPPYSLGDGVAAAGVVVCAGGWLMRMTAQRPAQG